MPRSSLHRPVSRVAFALALGFAMAPRGAVASECAGPVGEAFVAPSGREVITAFGPRRHPLFGDVRMHAGLDYGGPVGDPVVATRSGRVAEAGQNGADGKFVRLDHGGGLASRYTHLSAIAVEPGVCVARGAAIGAMGSTGLATGPHLHFEVLSTGRLIDPAPLITGK